MADRLGYPIWIGLLLASIGVLYLATLAQNHTEAEDSVFLILGATNGSHLFQPNHLLFGFLNHLLYTAWQWAGYAGNAELPMALVNVSASLVALFFTYTLCLKIGIRPPMALLVTACVSVTFGFWIYAVETDTYSLPLPFILLSAHVLVDAGDGLSKNGHADALKLGVLAACATLLHQQNIALLPAIALSLSWCFGRFYPQRGQGFLFRKLATFGCTALFLIAAAYLYVAVAVYHKGALAEIIEWAMGNAQGGILSRFSWTSPLKSLIGVFRAIWGTNFLYASPRMSEWIQHLFPNKIFLEEQYVARGLGEAALWTIVAATLAGILSSAALLWHGVLTKMTARASSIGTKRPARARLFAVFTGWFVVWYAAAITLWDPVNPEFWIVLIPVCLPWLGMQLGLISKVQKGFVIALLVSLILANGLGAAWPYRVRQTDFWYQANRYLIDRAALGDLLVTECGYMCNGYLRLFTPTKVLMASELDLASLTTRIAKHPCGRVLVSSWALGPPPKGITKGPLPHEHGEGLAAALQDRLVELDRNEIQTIWRVERPLQTDCGERPYHESQTKPIYRVREVVESTSRDAVGMPAR